MRLRFQILVPETKHCYHPFVCFWSDLSGILCRHTHLQEEVKHELEPINASWTKSILQNLPTYFLLAFEHWNSGLSNTWYKLTLRLTKLIICAQWQIVLRKEYNKWGKKTSTWYTGKKTLIYYWEFTNSPLCHVHLLGAQSFKQIWIT